MQTSKINLPHQAQFTGTTGQLSEKTIRPAMLKKHMTPCGKIAVLSVTQGRIQFIWDDTEEVIDVIPSKPLVIAEERYHHLRLTSEPVLFRVDFYSVPQKEGAEKMYDPTAVRPGENYCRP